jgi:putative radical SAM enzyme (TIGR03279 family)
VKNLALKALVAQVQSDSIAEKIGLVAGDIILTVNGETVKDIIDLSFALADEKVTLVVAKKSGGTVTIPINKTFDENLGIEFESAVFDQVRCCANRCIFCFVDQMPRGMRDSLYVKDDDYRLSFLYGNFITLSNLGPNDHDRIGRLHLSPLYISIHTTNGELRSQMLNNKQAANIMEQLVELITRGVQFHGQIVLCPGFNDGENLKKTFEDIYRLVPAALSLAIVPVGLTQFREDCYDLPGFTSQQCAETIDLIAPLQDRCRREQGSTFVYLGDEFYVAAGREIPTTAEYDDFPQLENGIGMVRNFIDEWHQCSFATSGYDQPIYIDVVCGVSAAKIIEPLVKSLAIKNLNVRVVPVINSFFGKHITVTGLLTGQDIIDQLQCLDGPRDGIILPGVALRKGESIFLDNMVPEEISEHLAVPVRIAYFSQDLVDCLLHWR